MAAGSLTTKYQAGGSGDNYIAQGFIKTVEKVWMDSYTIAFTNTNTTIDIAVLQPNARITQIGLEIETSAAQTNGTISVGCSTDANIDSFMNPTTLSHNTTRTSILLPYGGIMMPTATSTTLILGKMAGFQFVVGNTNGTLTVKLNNWTMTTGTLKTIVRYT